jgi:hypothetical protein
MGLAAIRQESVGEYGDVGREIDQLLDHTQDENN